LGDLALDTVIVNINLVLNALSNILANNNLRMDIIELKARFNEEFKLSEDAKRDLEEARKTMRQDFVTHEEIMKKYG